MENKRERIITSEVPEFIIRWLDKQQELRNAEADREAWLEQYIKPMPAGATSFSDLFVFMREQRTKKIRRIMQ
jgi:hypothetical protein